MSNCVAVEAGVAPPMANQAQAQHHHQCPYHQGQCRGHGPKGPTRGQRLERALELLTKRVWLPPPRGTLDRLCIALVRVSQVGQHPAQTALDHRQLLQPRGGAKLGLEQALHSPLDLGQRGGFGLVQPHDHLVQVGRVGLGG